MWKFNTLEVGTFQIHGSDLIEKVLNIALNAGYRHIGK